MNRTRRRGPSFFVVIVRCPSTRARRSRCYSWAPRPAEAPAVGAAVEARFRGDVEWFPGKIDGVSEDGTYAPPTTTATARKKIRRSFGPRRSRRRRSEAKQARKVQVYEAGHSRVIGRIDVRGLPGYAGSMSTTNRPTGMAASGRRPLQETPAVISRAPWARSSAASPLRLASKSESEDGSRPSNTAANKKTVALMPEPQ